MKEIFEINLNAMEYIDNKTQTLKSLAAIERIKNGDLQVLKSEKWLKYLALTSERNVNLERLNSLEEMKNNYVLNYVERTLKALANLKLSEYQRYIIEETLKWSEVAKSGLTHQRELWTKKGYNLFVHNIGSAEIYLEETSESDPETKKIVHNLILTHGLIGQYIRGEVPLSDNRPLHQLVEEGNITASELREILKALNYCIVTAVNENIWGDISEKAEETIEIVVNGQFEKQYGFKDRIKRLRAVSIKNGENFDVEYEKILSDSRIIDKLVDLLEVAELWYVEAALYDFSFEEFVKILLIISRDTLESSKQSLQTEREVNLCNAKHISFEGLMKDIYYQHEGKKRVNIYKKRIIEKYLSDITMKDILEGSYKENLHVVHMVTFHESLENTVFFTFQFSAACSKLIEFCIDAEKSDVLYENAIILLFELFAF